MTIPAQPEPMAQDSGLLIAFWCDRWAFGGPLDAAPADPAPETLALVNKDPQEARLFAIGFQSMLEEPFNLNVERVLVDWARLLRASEPLARLSFQTGAGAALIAYGRRHPTSFVLHAVCACLNAMHDRLMSQAPLTIGTQEKAIEHANNLRNLLTLGSAAKETDLRLDILDGFEGLLALSQAGLKEKSDKLQMQLLDWAESENDPEVRESLYDKMAMLGRSVPPRQPNRLIQRLKSQINDEQAGDETLALTHALAAYHAVVMQCLPYHEASRDAAFLAEQMKNRNDPIIQMTLTDNLDEMLDADSAVATSDVLTLLLSATQSERDDDLRLRHLATLRDVLRLNKNLHHVHLGTGMAMMAKDEALPLEARLKALEIVALVLNNDPGTMRGQIGRPLNKMARLYATNSASQSLQEAAQKTLALYRDRKSGRVSLPIDPEKIIFTEIKSPLAPSGAIQSWVCKNASPSASSTPNQA